MTRLLDAPPRRSARPGRAAAPPELAKQEPARRSAHAALESALLRGFVYGISGLVWLFVLALAVRHLSG
jgi:hypothetical protein